jgi:hypothetical protein
MGGRVNAGAPSPDIYRGCVSEIQVPGRAIGAVVPEGEDVTLETTTEQRRAQADQRRAERASEALRAADTLDHWLGRFKVYHTTPTTCGCPDAQYRHATCKHMRAMAMLAGHADGGILPPAGVLNAKRAVRRT